MAYTPNKAIHPGHAIARELERTGMTQKNLSDRTGLSEKHISQIINGEASFSVDTALLLENALGGSASFWINLEKNYQETKARLERGSLLRKEVGLLARFPYAELAKRKCVEKAADKEKKIENLWKFFGVNSLNSVQVTEAIAYRKRARIKVKEGPIAAWLRCGELGSKETKVAEFSDSTLKQALGKLRELTIKAPEVFSVESRKILAESGVSLVYVPHFPGAGVSAAVRWLAETPLIQLSLLGAYADIFWFNLFHEIGHLLLHGKKEKFIEFDNRDLRTVQEKEKEADIFASNELIPWKSYEEFTNIGDFSRKGISEFARIEGIDPGIVEGRLCYDHKISWSKPLGFRTRLRFTD
ncbi:MAG TPA: HigA family addiction module antitoxin [Terriglobia bacterium]|nr:HigA family addiction module antitoxin [Terriglobia bacterium]